MPVQLTMLREKTMPRSWRRLRLGRNSLTSWLTRRLPQRPPRISQHMAMAPKSRAKSEPSPPLIWQTTLPSWNRSLPRKKSAPRHGCDVRRTSTTKRR